MFATLISIVALGVGSIAKYLLDYHNLNGPPDRVGRVITQPSGVTHALYGAVGASRTWNSREAGPVSLTFEVAAIGQSEYAPWEYLPEPHGAPTQSPLLEDGTLAVSGQLAGVTRSLLVLSEPLAQREFTIRFHAEPAEPGSHVAGTVALSTQDGRHKGSLNFEATSATTIELTWSPKEPITTHVLVAALSNVSGEGVIGLPEFTEASAGTLTPSASIAVNSNGIEKVVHVDQNWQVFVVSGFESESGSFTARFTVGSGSHIELRRIEATSVTTNRALAVRPVRARVTLFGIHPNLLAHTTVSLLALLFLLATRRWILISGTAFGYLAITAFGSRTALLAATLGLICFLLLSNRRSRTFTTIAVAVMAVLTLVFSFGNSFQRDPDAGVSSRGDIWAVATQGFLDNPVSGIQTTFAEYWSNTVPDTAVIGHAHNFWLEMATLHGLVGLLLSVLATLLVAALLWRRYGPRCLAMLVPLLVLNFFDYTVNYPGVYLPLLVGLLVGSSPEHRLRSRRKQATQ